MVYVLVFFCVQCCCIQSFIPDLADGNNVATNSNSIKQINKQTKKPIFQFCQNISCVQLHMVRFSLVPLHFDGECQVSQLGYIWPCCYDIYRDKKEIYSLCSEIYVSQFCQRHGSGLQVGFRAAGLQLRLDISCKKPRVTLKYLVVCGKRSH